MVAQIGYSVAGRSRGRVALCAVCTIYVETGSAGFSVEPQNQGLRFINGLALKPLRRFSPIWPQNRWRRFSPIWPQNRWQRYPGLGLKIGSYSLVIWASKPPRRFLGLDLKTKQSSVCRLCHKTNGGRTVRDTRQDLVTCFVWKQVALGFPSLASRLAEA
jgi:hypothetical protein